MKSQRQLLDARTRKALSYALLIAIALGLLLPFFWMISASLKGDEEIFAVPPRFIPDTFRWDNYSDVFNRMPFLAYLRNTTFITVLTIIGTVLSSSLVAYAFACLRWPGRDKLFVFVIATMMLPLHVLMIPLFVIFKELHWLNTYKPLIIPAWLGGGAFNIFLLRQFFLGIPKELFDAARIDGCSEFRIYRTIAMPLARPALITVAYAISDEIHQHFVPDRNGTPLDVVIDTAGVLLAIALTVWWTGRAAATTR